MGNLNYGLAQYVNMNKTLRGCVIPLPLLVCLAAPFFVKEIFYSLPCFAFTPQSCWKEDLQNSVSEALFQ